MVGFLKVGNYAFLWIKIQLWNPEGICWEKRSLNNPPFTTPLGVVRPLLAEVGLCKWLILQGPKMVERA